VGTARLIGLDAVGVGDRTVRLREEGDGLNEPWARGWVRDQVACVKTVWDHAVHLHLLANRRSSAARESGRRDIVRPGSGVF
jgi:hypothetical protein